MTPQEDDPIRGLAIGALSIAFWVAVVVWWGVSP